MWAQAVSQQCLDQTSCSQLTLFTTPSSAIEEELEVLYDAYYEELESYALHQQRYASSPGTVTPPPGPGPFPGSVDAAAAAPAAPQPPAKKSGGIVKPTRDHKNVRPAANAKKRTNAPANHHGHNHEPAHGEPGHTHSPSCPHHPHNHGTHPAPTAQAKAKGAVIDDHYDDEEGDEEDEEDDEEVSSAMWPFCRVTADQHRFQYDDDEYDDEEDDEEDVSAPAAHISASRR